METSYEPLGNNGQTGISDGHDYGFDDDFRYSGVQFKLIKCEEDMDKLKPTSISGI